MLYLVFEPSSEDHRARFTHFCPAEICFGHADLHPHVQDIRSQENCISSSQTLAAEIQFGLVHGQSAQGLQDWLGLLDLHELLGLLNRDVVLEQIYAGQQPAVLEGRGKDLGTFSFQAIAGDVDLAAFMSTKLFEAKGSLASLSLADNRIQAEGAQHIAEVLPKWSNQDAAAANPGRTHSMIMLNSQQSHNYIINPQ